MCIRGPCQALAGVHEQVDCSYDAFLPAAAGVPEHDVVSLEWLWHVDGVRTSSSETASLQMADLATSFAAGDAASIAARTAFRSLSMRALRSRIWAACSAAGVDVSRYRDLSEPRLKHPP